MVEVDINGEFVLTISDSSDIVIDQSFTERFESATLVKKGQIIAGNRVAEKSIWSYVVEFDSYISFVELFRVFINKVSENIHFINELKNSFESIKIAIFIRSDYGQLGYQIPGEILCDLAKLELDLEFHILSFGMVSVKST